MHKLNIIRGAVLLAAAALLITGICMNSEMQVWQKATHICFDCIGIG